MPWDPLGAWPNERRWIWLTIAGWLLVLRGPAFVENLQARPPRGAHPRLLPGVCLGPELARGAADLCRPSGDACRATWVGSSTIGVRMSS